MLYRILLFLLMLLALAGCTAPELIPPPQPTAGTVAPFTPHPTRGVTLANATLPASTAVPSLGVTVTLRGEGQVNLRSGPGTTYPVVAQLASGARVEASARSEHGEWLLVTSADLPGGLAWVYALYTDYDAGLHPLPVATARPAQP
jgi:uncharacterized protein YraI